MALVVAAWLGAGLVGAAGAQVDVGDVGDPTDGVLTEPGEHTALDTDHTPVAKQTDLWRMLHGTPYEGIEPLDGSVTGFDVDLHALSLRDSELGFAGGSRCAEPPEREPGESPGAYGQRVTGCGRVPVVYRFTYTDERGEVWEQDELPGDGEPGYVGAIAWIDDGRALAVGGTGVYPRREVARGETESFEDWVAKDPAGFGRAWLFEDGAWSELDLSGLIEGESDGMRRMRGMTAVGFHPGEASLSEEWEDAPEEFGAAGALGQLWEWEDGEFTRLLDRTTPDEELFNSERFETRVRDLGFADSGSRVQAYGGASGCCRQDPLENAPQILAHDDGFRPLASQDDVPRRWYLRDYGKPKAQEPTVDTSQPLLFAWGEEVRSPPGADASGLPDTIYSLPVSGSNCADVVASPGGPERELERPAVVAGQTLPADGSFPTVTLSTLTLASRLHLSSLHLVSGAGHTGFQCDGPDWSVGDRRSTELPGLGAQGVVLATHLPPEEGAQVRNVPGVQCCTLNNLVESGGSAAGDAAAGHLPEVEGEDRALHPLRSQLFELPSYSLNGVDVVVGEAGIAWAVGDRGAILRVDDDELAARTSSEPDAAHVGRAREAELSDRSPFDGFRPVTGEDVEAGVVPSLRSRPRLRLAERVPVDAGAPDVTGPGHTVSEIVMSRDGSEGWAVGGSTNRMTLHRFRDGEWRPCRIDERPGRPADPACAGLQEVSHLRLTAAARVPVERGDDPTGADEFEVVAAGRPHGGRPLLLRYRDGRWEREDPEARASVTLGGLNDLALAVAFTAPDDGWLLYGTRSSQRLYHFDGERWVACVDDRDACGDPDGRLAVTEQALNPPLLTPGDNSRARLAGMATAGERTYVFGLRRVDGGDRFPMIAYKDPGKKWTAEDGGFDPAWEHTQDPTAPPPDSRLRGWMEGLAVAELADGGYGGWGVGEQGAEYASSTSLRVRAPDSVLWRLSGAEWAPFSDGGPVGDYMRYVTTRPGAAQMVAIPRPDGSVDAAIAEEGGDRNAGRVMVFREDAQRFEVMVDSGRPAGTSHTQRPQGRPRGVVRALASDGEGGLWMAVEAGTPASSSSVAAYFYRYTDSPHEPVLSEAPMPVVEGRLGITDVAGSRDGSVWLSTDSDTLYRYDRLTGWERVRVPGWDPGAVATVSSPAHAVAVGPDGSGVVVGRGGRIARVGRGGAVLDRAAGRACDVGDPVPPCSTGRDLRAVDLAPDGSAIAAGDRVALLWRPGGGEFGTIRRPVLPASTNLVAVAMPRSDRAWLLTNTSRVFRGAHAGGGEWTWREETVAELRSDGQGGTLAVRDLDIDEQGRGYAVGDGGLVLARSGDGSWRRVQVASPDYLTSVSLPVGGGEGALIGGRDGLVLTLIGGRWEVARHGGFPGVTEPVTGAVLLPGMEDGQSEAWVAIAAPSVGAVIGSAGANRLLHYSSEPHEALLSPDGRVSPLPDAPAPRPGEITFAALGKSECRTGPRIGCAELGGTTEPHEVVLRRSVAEIAARARRQGGPAFSVFTGDAIDEASQREPETVGLVDPTTQGLAWGPRKLRRWREMVADRLDRAGVPLLGTLGAQDLANYGPCDLDGRCYSTHEHTRSGDNLAWREAFEGRRAPWGDGSDPDLVPADAVSLRPVSDRGLSVRGEGALSGASAHYAADVERGGETVARLVFADSSLRSLSASEAQQQPVDPGGQAAWLERVLCRRPGRAPTGEACSRPADAPAVVVTNTPTYSYGPSPGSETMTDAAAFEAVLMRHRVSVAVAGRLGWNARYWAVAPGLHEPCAGGSYRDEPPEPGVSACGEQVPGVGEGAGSLPEAPGQAELVADALGAAGLPAPPVDPGDSAGVDPEHLSDPTGAGVPVSVLPFVVASSAGGKLANQTGQARDGFWQGYSIVRVPANGDPRGVIVEQRPVYDHVFLTAQERRLRPGQRVTLRGYGRGPIATHGLQEVARTDRIDSDAVTHRYDLLEADPQRPWLPRRDASGEYVPLDPSIATVDQETGEVRTGRGDHLQTFAVAVLSVGEHAASYPMVFEPRRSFRAVREQPEPVALPTPQPPAPVPQVAGVPAAPPPPPPPPPPAPPPPGVSTPPFPALPALPSLGAPPAVGPPAAPAPPATPPLPTPPTFSQAAPLGIAAEVGAIGVQGSVVPPSPPPVNPAPPGGSAARKEAKQRQAATAKSEEGGQDSAGEATREAGGDMVGSSDEVPGSQSMTRAEHNAATRRDPERPAPSFTATASEQPSAWTRGLLYAGGLGGAALILALGASTLRPTPRRRTPPAPAPAWARIRGSR